MNKDTLTIREYHSETDPYNSKARSDGHGNSEIEYMPRIRHHRRRPPSAVLYHEMAHVYDYMNGTFIRDEYVGDDPRTPTATSRSGSARPRGSPSITTTIRTPRSRSTPTTRSSYTENGLRDEMGLPNRDHYA